MNQIPAEFIKAHAEILQCEAEGFTHLARFWRRTFNWQLMQLGCRQEFYSELARLVGPDAEAFTIHHAPKA